MVAAVRRLSVVHAAAVLAAVALTLAACAATEEPPRPTSTAPVVQLGAPGEGNRTMSAEEQLAATASPHTETDVAFVRDMLHHHAQALVMTDYVGERASSDSIRLLAERMQVSQQDEMGQLEAWLQQRGEPVTDPDAPHGAHTLMPGMLTDDELAALEAADGVAFDELFLRSMIRHHEGALVMIAELYGSEDGAEPELAQLAGHFDSDQRIEIARMSSMLAELEG
ncbi:DUF305 domain-containing protein [Microbacterium sp. HD4P20]|uniref:DUF305 domain-containing protein n=1 Tax=Microbacterium sp. HD4P20 TaxID=2864874 RepID=UPI001C63D7DC|nr:DUF305 domain-containing protein [Microbacterium sp. HD4P20]MCP2635336.1 DUF305 domain-containing protein [Microbacterium sp. HD4P20]